MGEGQQSLQDPAVVKAENARIGYQAAIDLATAEAEHNWARFNGMLVANSIVIGAIGLALTGQGIPVSLRVGLSIVGLVLCIVWLSLMKRGFDYEKYFVLSARELEKKHLADVVKTLERGGSFANGREVTFEIQPPDDRHQMSCLARFLRARHASYAVILIFGILYVMALFWP